MREDQSSDRPTAGELRTAALLRVAPWLALLFVTLPLPLYFLFRYLTATEDVAVYLLFALTTLAVGALAGLLVACLLVLYRWHWERAIRRRLVADGITVRELPWFES